MNYEHSFKTGGSDFSAQKKIYAPILKKLNKIIAMFSIAKDKFVQRIRFFSF